MADWLLYGYFEKLMRQQMIVNPIKKIKRTQAHTNTHTHTPSKKPYTAYIGIGWYDSTSQEEWKLQNICNEIGFLWKTDESLTAND